MRPDELERRLRERLDALGPLPAPSCFTSSCCPDSRQEKVARLDALLGAGGSQPGRRDEVGSRGRARGAPCRMLV